MNDADARIFSRLSSELTINEKQIHAVAELLDEGSTVPFIARYRKEKSGNLDETRIIAIRDGLAKNRDLEKRRAFILESIDKQGALTLELQRDVQSAGDSNRLEDLYLPYKQKRETRGSRARKQGLEDLARKLASGAVHDPLLEAAHFVSPSDGPASAADALTGALDIIAEDISLNPDLRHSMRILFRENGVLQSLAVKKKQKEEAAAIYRDYFEHREAISRIKGHRLLAMLRGQREGFLRLSLEPDREQALKLIGAIHFKGLPQPFLRTPAGEALRRAAEDGYARLVKPSLENEILKLKREAAEKEAISVFSENLRQLLLSPPLGPRITLGVDPGLRTGCKLVVIGREGELLESSVIYPLAPREDTEGAARTVHGLADKYRIEAVAVGNGTGGREALRFINELALGPEVTVASVNESGASVYSASEIARREFPHEDLTVRGAVSIARRLVDPLAELVKIDPRSIGVGQYQHDVDQKALQTSLADVVSSCVNAVGVNLNTASDELLSYVSGLSTQLGRKIVEYRVKKGGFRTRQQLLNVPGLGEKTFQQAAGFLRILDGDHPLDASAVHPERYALVERMAKSGGYGLADLIRDSTLPSTIPIDQFVEKEVGLPTLQDIISELEKPGRDPRPPFEDFAFSEDVHTIEDVKPGMRLPGLVTNITKFGAFVDIGVHQDGLVHISQMADRFVSDPGEAVRLGQKVIVRVLEVDARRRRISLSLKKT